MIVFQCAGCGKAYELADAIGGRTIPCNKCREPMQVPLKGQVVPPSVSNAAPAGVQSPPPMPGPSTGMIPQQPSVPQAAPYVQQPPQQQYPPQPQYPPQQQYPMQQYPQQGQYPAQQQNPQGQYPMGNQGNPYATPTNPQTINVHVQNTGKPAEKKSGYASASLACGVIGLLIFGIILGPLAIVFGIISMSQGEENSGSAGVGIVLGIIDVFAFFVLIAMMNA